MKISPTKPYEDKIIKETAFTRNVNETSEASKENTNVARNANENFILSKQERDYFIDMFPESSERLRSHKLFNNNGKVNSPNLYKGMIVDGRV